MGKRGMSRKTKHQLAAAVVVTLGVADGVGIYVAQHRLDKPARIGSRELAVANAPLAEPIAIRANGELKPAPALAVSAFGPREAQAPAAAAQRTVRVALPEPMPVPDFARAPAPRQLARQTAPVVTGALAAVQTPARRVAAERRAIALETRAVRTGELRVHEQRIPSRVTRFEHTPARVDTFTAAFAQSDDEIRLPEPAFRYGQPIPQASAELPPLELSDAQVHSAPAGAPDADMPAAPPATATSSDVVLPKS